MSSKEWTKANQDKMRKYRRDWYYRNKESSLKRARERNARVREENRQLLITLKSFPCKDCGIQYPPYVMQFDHINDDKEYNVSHMVSSCTPTQILEESKKCEIVCANCHMERTHGSERRLSLTASKTE